MRTLALAALGFILAVPALHAQVPTDTAARRPGRADSARAAPLAEPTPPAGVDRARRDTLSGPPISPKSAFIRSLLVPGLGQAALDRGMAGGIFVSIEALSILMVIKSNQDLRVARRVEGDSIFVGFDAQGDTIKIAGPLEGRVRPRKQHVEDWVAILVFNHLFAGADAFVAALLWDVPARVSVQRDGDKTRLTATVRW